jgi:hypothetical protein
MREWYTQLIECLKKETAHYRNISVLARQQKDLLVAGDVDVLPANVRLEEKEVFALGPLIARRNDLLKEIAASLGLKNINLAEAVQKAPVEVVEEFKAAVMDLVQSARGLEDINRGNEKLLKNALSYVDFTLKVIADGGKKKTFYSASSGAEEKKSTFVNRVV